MISNTRYSRHTQTRSECLDVGKTCVTSRYSVHNDVLILKFVPQLDLSYYLLCPSTY